MQVVFNFYVTASNGSPRLRLPRRMHDCKMSMSEDGPSLPTLLLWLWAGKVYKSGISILLFTFCLFCVCKIGLVG